MAESIEPKIEFGGGFSSSGSPDDTTNNNVTSAEPERPPSVPVSKLRSPTSQRRSGIPVPMKSQNAAIPSLIEPRSPPSSAPPSPPLLTPLTASSSTEIGIMESTPSFHKFVASMDEFSYSDVEEGDSRVKVTVPRRRIVDNVVYGEGKPEGISTTSDSFTGFVNTIISVQSDDILEPRYNVGPRGATALDLTGNEKSQDGTQDSQSKNETRHRKHRRLRTGNYPALSEEQFLRMFKHVKNNACFDTMAVSVQSDVSVFRLLEPIQFPPFENKSQMKQLFKDVRVPKTFDKRTIFEAEDMLEKSSTEKTKLPLNLKRLSQQDLEPKKSTGVGTLPAMLSRYIEMFPTHDEKGMMGCLFIQNKTPHVITFRIQSSIARRYTVNPSVGQIGIGSGILVFVQTLESEGFTFNDIKDDQFLVEVIPLCDSFTELHSLILFWKCEFEVTCRFLVELTEQFKNPGLASVRASQMSKVNFVDKLRSMSFMHSEELFQLRHLESESIAACRRMTLNELNQNNGQENPDTQTQYGIILGSAIFGIALMIFMSFILLSS